MKYVDGFVVAVPADKKDAYLQLAARAAPLFKAFGATRIVECWATTFRLEISPTFVGR
jgi:uncharacterized protein YbaA (DUF1428 family)